LLGKPIVLLGVNRNLEKPEPNILVLNAVIKFGVHQTIFEKINITTSSAHRRAQQSIITTTALDCDTWEPCHTNLDKNAEG